MSRKRFLFVLFLIFTLVMLILINYRIADRSIPVEVISYTDASKYFMHIKTVEMPINFVFDTKNIFL